MPNLDIKKLAGAEPRIICIGSHPGITQSILDFDFLLGRSQPSIVAIIAGGRKSERYFFGEDEVLIPVYESVGQLPEAVQQRLNLFLNFTSGRRVLSSTSDTIAALPNLIGGTIFAERVPERHALDLASLGRSKKIWIAGGSSVGLMLPGKLKLGAIGGVQARQVEASNLFIPGQVAVVSTSGGMVNEIIRFVANTGHGVSFAVALGGERYPVLSPEDVFLAAEKHSGTKAIAYFGELGGDDEYRLAQLIKDGKVTKPVIAYVAGAVAEVFEKPPQFGHAKAMAATANESATAKAAALRASGATVGKTFAEFAAAIQQLKLKKVGLETRNAKALDQRRKKLITASVSYDKDEEVYILGQKLLDMAANQSFAAIAGSMLLGKQLESAKTEHFIDFVLKLLVDHGPYVSGAVNTIVAARAGKDLVSSLAAGLLTIGPRFGGAINESAAIWLKGVQGGYVPAQLVEEYAANKVYISGIGHKKYRVDLPDPRVAAILNEVSFLKERTFVSFAQAVEKETVAKKGNLILNVDGAIAACLLDILREEEGYSTEELQRLTDVEFFNGLFVLSRTVGFMAHYFDQARLDEGLFRLSPDQVAVIKRHE